MASTSATSPGTGANNTTVGTVAWSNPGNITTSNNTRATAALNNSTSNYLMATNFAFTVPTNAVITGILVEIEKSRTAGTGTLQDSRVHLVKRGTILSNADNKASATAWTGSDAYASYGGSSDLWGAVWTAADLNAFDFGVVISAVETASLAATAGVDHIRVTVSYDEGYASQPQVQQAGEILLYGQRYRLAPEKDGSPGRVRTTLATQFPPKVVTNQDYGRDSHPVMSTWAVDDLRGGMGLFRYRTPEDLNRYWTGRNFDGLYQGAFTLGPLITDLDEPAGVNQAINAINLLGGTLIAVLNNVVYNHDGTNWSAIIDTLPAAPVDSIYFNPRVYYALGSSGYCYQTTASGVATDVAAGANDPAVHSWCVWDGKIWALDTAGKIWDSTTGNAGTWTNTRATLPIQDHTASDLVVYRDDGGDSVIYALTAFGPWLYDAVNDTWMQQDLQFPFFRRVNTRRGGGAVYRNVMYVHAADRTVFALDMLRRTIADASFAAPDGAPWTSESANYAGFVGELKKFVTDNTLLFALHGTSRANTTASWGLVVFNGLGWHPFYENTDTAANGQDMFIANATNHAYRLYFEDVGSAVGNTNFLKYFPLAPLRENPLYSSTGRTYAVSGFVELPYFDGFAPEQGKTAQQVRIKLAGASSTETVQVAYRINGSTGSYTNLGSAVAVNEEVALPFGTNNVGLGFKSMQLRLTFARGNTTTAAPKVEYCALDYLRQPEVLRGLTVSLDLSDTYYGRTPQQQVDALWAAMKADTFGTCAWRDDSGNVRSLLVKVMSLDGAEESGFDWRSGYTLRLLEMGRN